MSSLAIVPVNAEDFSQSHTRLFPSPLLVLLFVILPIAFQVVPGTIVGISPRLDTSLLLVLVLYIVARTVLEMYTICTYIIYNMTYGVDSALATVYCTYEDQ